MGSQSDWETMRHAAETLTALGVDCEKRIVSAHRTPDRLFAFAKGAKAAGFKVIIAGAGGAAHLPGMAAALTELPVFGVPVESKALSGIDSLLLDRADAGRRSRRHAGDRQGRRHQRRAARGQRARAERRGAGRRGSPPGASSRPTRSRSARRDRRDRFRQGEAEAGRHHRNSRRRTIGPDAGDGGGAPRPADARCFRRTRTRPPSTWC